MSIRQSHICALIVGGILVFTGGAIQAEQSTSGSQSSGAMKQKGSAPITEGNPDGSVILGGRGKAEPLEKDQGKESTKSGHESSGKMGAAPYGQADEPKVGGEATLGGSGRIPDSSKSNPGSTTGKGSSGGNGSSSGSGSGSMGSGGGTGSSGGGGK